jgi:hypothetical protein
MNEHPQSTRAVDAVFFSLIMACLLGFGGLLLGMYLYGYFGKPTVIQMIQTFYCAEA